jgi:hypothetical protein
LVIVPSYSSAVRSFGEIQKLALKAMGEYGAAAGAHDVAAAHFNELAATRPVLDRDRQCARTKMLAAEKAMERARKPYETVRNGAESWRAWAVDAWVKLEASFKARCRAGEIQCFALPVHELTAGRRARVPMSLIDALSFESTTARHPVGRVYEMVVFYELSANDEEAASPPTNDDTPLVPPGSETLLVNAAKDGVRAAALAVYRDNGALNFRDAEKLIREALRKEGRRAGKDDLRELLREDEFVNLRRKPGRPKTT